MKKEEFSEKELLEFAIYHDIIDKNSRIPGVKSNGYPDFDFFPLSFVNCGHLSLLPM